MLFRLSTAVALAVSLALCATGFSATAQKATQKPAVFTELVKGVAVGGHDPVAYFTVGKPVAGDPEITLTHDGAVWRFASEANREAFRADPAKYAPQFGGYCAWAVANGYTAKGDPNAWTVSNGKLYLNYNKSVQKGWEQDIPGNVRKGDANWPTVLAK